MNMPAIPEKQRIRLASLCGMLGSDHDGERASAAVQANRIVQDSGLTWREIIDAAFPASAPKPEPAMPAQNRGSIYGDHAEVAEWLLDNAETRSAWERAFLHNIKTSGHISEKQRVVSTRIIIATEGHSE